jgi:NADH-quinone oxidoreductase subunit A
MEAIVPILVLTLIVATFGSLLVFVSSVVGHKKQYTRTKYMPYECGLPGQESEKTNVSVRYYLTAILFIVFDIEILFMFPWALTYKEFISAGHGAYIFWVMFVFIALFLFGLIWEIRSKALEWD